MHKENTNWGFDGVISRTRDLFYAMSLVDLQRSPDWSPCDYFFCGCLKAEIYKHRPATIDELKAKKCQNFFEICLELIRRLANKFNDWLLHCTENRGHVFRNKIKVDKNKRYTTAFCLILLVALWSFMVYWSMCTRIAVSFDWWQVNLREIMVFMWSMKVFNVFFYLFLSSEWGVCEFRDNIIFT